MFFLKSDKISVFVEKDTIEKAQFNFHTYFFLITFFLMIELSNIHFLYIPNKKKEYFNFWVFKFNNKIFSNKM